MKVFIGSDHAGYALKTALVPFLASLGHEVADLGAHRLEDSDDYPDFIAPVAEAVAAEPDSSKVRGIVIGASGQGEAILANRFPRVRAAVFYGEPAHPQTDAEGHVLGMIASERAHNDTNVLSLGARFVSESEAKEAVRLWLTTPFSLEERHRRRIEEIEKAAAKYSHCV